MGRYFEDFRVGERFVTKEETVTEEALIAFGCAWDPQVFHTDPEQAKKSTVGRLIASGWHTAALTMRLMVQSKFFDEMIGAGVDDLRWPKPVYPGDRLHVVGEIESMRASRSKPIGLVSLHYTTFNQHGEIVMDARSTLVPQRRP